MPASWRASSENNIPVVGKEQVAEGPRDALDPHRPLLRGRSPTTPRSHFQPLTCQQCENAPCEVVCPVAATVHNEEGLNDMVYNRCVGTRYCANNCPYKVRRFNFLLFADWDTKTLKMARNPEVTVRSRGVMEKCTYCVQRINSRAHRGQARGPADPRRRDRHRLPGGLPDAGDPLRRPERPGQPGREAAHAEPRNYGLLEDLNTRPRTTYLAAVRNPNPVLTPEAARCPRRRGQASDRTG